MAATADQTIAPHVETTFSSEVTVSTARVPCRLDKFMSDYCGLDKADQEALIAAGHVTLTDAAGADLLADVRPDIKLMRQTLVLPEDTVTVNGAPVTRAQPARVYAIFKPRGMVTSLVHIRHSHEKHRRMCMRTWLDELVEKDGAIRRLFPVGRLDKMTTGLLLCTNDGDLAHRLLLPGLVPKEYDCGVSTVPTPEQLQRLRDGVELTDGPARALLAEVLHGGDKVVTDGTMHAFVRVRVVVATGRYHVVRRMMAHVGLPLHRLHRTRIGPLVRPAPLEPGTDSERLSDALVDELWAAAGGREAVAAMRLKVLARLAGNLERTGRRHDRLSEWLLARGITPTQDGEGGEEEAYFGNDADGD